MQLLNIKEAACLLRLSVPAIRNLIRYNKIPFTKPSGKILFIESDLINWVDSGKVATTKKEVANG